MEIKIACTSCSYSFVVNTDEEDGNWIKCPKCNKEMGLTKAIKPLLQEIADDPEYEIECGTLSAYHGFSQSIRLPRSVSVIEGGYRNDGSHDYWDYSDSKIRKGCFEDSSVESVEFSTSIRVIRDYAFANCRYLRKVILPEGLVHIGRGAFEKCESLEEVQIPITCTDIGVLCFSEC